METAMSWVDLLVATGEMLVVGVLISVLLIAVGTFAMNSGFRLAEWWGDRKERCHRSR